MADATDRPAVLPLDDVIRTYTLAALLYHGGKSKPTAKALGVHPSSLNGWLKKWRAAGLIPAPQVPTVPEASR